MDELHSIENRGDRVAIILLPLSSRLADRQQSAVGVIDLASVVAEIELAQITMQVMASDLVINARQSTLEDGEYAFNRVGVNGGHPGLFAGILASRVIHHAMLAEASAHAIVRTEAIRHNDAARMHVLLHHAQQVLSGNALNMERANITITLYDRENRLLRAGVGTSATALHLYFSADVSFVGFHDSEIIDFGRERSKNTLVL